MFFQNAAAIITRMETVWNVLLIFLLIFLNGYFVASEFALVALRKTKIDELVKKGNKTAKLIKEAHDHLDTYISATQLGITLASIGLGWVGEPTIAELIESLFSSLPENIAFISVHTIAFIIAFSLITFFHIVLGELAPKTLALQQTEGVALFVVPPLMAFTSIFRPFIWLLNHAGTLVLKPFGLALPSGEQGVHSEDEIRMLLSQSSAKGVIASREAEMVNNVFKLGDTPIRHIMMPRTDIIAFPISTKIKTIEKQIKENTHSRFPIYNKTIDDIVGYIHIRDVYQYLVRAQRDKSLANTKLIRQIITVPETRRIDRVLIDMRKKRAHMAVVLDEYGGTAGIVTLEDVMESLVGEIEDEFDKPRREISKQKDGVYLIDGLTPIEHVEEQFGLHINARGYTTIGGFLFGQIGKEPNIGDIVQIDGHTFTVKQIIGKRINTIAVTQRKLKN